MIVESSIRSSPLNPQLGTTALLETEPGNGLRKSDMGWFQTEVTEEVRPTNAGKFLWQADSPANTNGDTQVQTSLSVALNVASPDGGGGVNFGYSKSVTKDITDWAVLNKGAGSVGSWRYANQNPYDDDTPDQWSRYGPGGGLEGFGKQRVPNDLASGELAIDTQIAFTTQGLLNTLEQFDTVITQEFANAYSKLFGIVRSELDAHEIPIPFQVDMSAVLPVPIAALTFDPPQGRPTQSNRVTGTVSLASPAKIDTVVNLASNSPNATVLPTVTIPHGKTSAEFEVLINANGLGAGDSTVATITATYGPSFQTQLTIAN